MIEIVQETLKYIRIESKENISYFPLPIYIDLQKANEDEDEEDKAWFASIAIDFNAFVNEDNIKVYEITEEEYLRLRGVLDMISNLTGHIK